MAEPLFHGVKLPPAIAFPFANMTLSSETNPGTTRKQAISETSEMLRVLFGSVAFTQ
jgi:hypothetical protein